MIIDERCIFRILKTVFPGREMNCSDAPPPEIIEHHTHKSVLQKEFCVY
jgi:hypothetical protein